MSSESNFELCPLDSPFDTEFARRSLDDLLRRLTLLPRDQRSLYGLLGSLRSFVSDEVVPFHKKVQILSGLAPHLRSVQNLTPEQIDEVVNKFRIDLEALCQKAGENDVDGAAVTERAPIMIED